MTNPPVNPAPKRTTLLSQTLNALFGFLCFILGSALLSILIEWLGLYFGWYVEKADHAKLIFEQEYQYLGQSIAIIAQHITSVVSVFDKLDQALHGMNQGLQVLVDVQSTGLTYVEKHIDPSFFTIIGEYLQSAKYVLMTVLVRTTILFLSTPLFIIAVLLGIIDGLIERELRKWGGGRESSNQFKIAKSMIWPIYLFAWVLYLSYPSHINHLWVVVPCAVFLCYLVRHTCFKMKKYF